MRVLVLLLSAGALCAQGVAPAYQAPEWMAYRTASIISEGTRMHAEVFTAKEGSSPKPCLLMAHGWGGQVTALRRDAAYFAQNGYYVVAFDYRGWGQSDARVILTKPAPKGQATFTAEVREVRGVVDPLDFGVDWINALHWLTNEEGCDKNRLGLWGSSFSGGLVVWAAARDPRVKAIHSQVGSLDGRELAQADAAATAKEAAGYARGDKQYPEAFKKEIGNLIGAPIRAKFALYAPVEEVNQAKSCAMQFVVAENEELFDNRNHAVKAYERFIGVKRLVSIPKIKHYGIYFEARDQAMKLAVEWFDEHLKNRQ
jgi:dienelactone hydrolase